MFRDVADINVSILRCKPEVHGDTNKHIQNQNNVYAERL